MHLTWIQYEAHLGVLLLRFQPPEIPDLYRAAPDLVRWWLLVIARFGAALFVSLKRF